MTRRRGGGGRGGGGGGGCRAQSRVYPPACDGGYDEWDGAESTGNGARPVE